ncbi:MAG: hypothetical protein C0501_26235 [Isosphaera sp.]|nr:hypothetical protein [Isosphaera sp.]
MVALYVAGNKVGTAADWEKLLPDFAAWRVVVEFRDDAGRPMGKFVPPEPICPWEPNLTKEEIDRRVAAGGGMSLAEFWKRMGVE